jgi:hypothetical protein
MLNKKRFKVMFSSPGIKYENYFCDTIKTAITKAHSKGWYGDQGGGSWDGCPIKATIFERITENGYETWEQVACVSKTEITLSPWAQRHSIKSIQKRIEELFNLIEDAKQLEVSIQQIKQEMNK